MSKKKHSEASSETLGLGRIVFMVFSYILIAVILLGLVLYLIAQYKLQTIFQPFELATVVGLVGGFIFVAGFRESADDRMKKRLKGIGSLCLFSAISFVIFGLFQAANQANLISTGTAAGLAKIVYPLTFYVGAVGFIGALLWTLWLIPDLTRNK